MAARRCVLLLLIPLAVLLCGNVYADTLIDFENLPDTNMFLGGGQNIGSFYTGVTFGPSVTGLDLTGSTAFPPHSGSIVVWDPFDLDVTIMFDAPVTTVSLWYTSFDPLTLQAFDSTSSSLGSVVGAANTDGTTGVASLLTFTGSNITSITLSGSPGNFVFDDFAFSSTVTVPEPSTVLLLLVGLTATLGLARRTHKV